MAETGRMGAATDDCEAAFSRFSIFFEFSAKVSRGKTVNQG